MALAGFPIVVRYPLLVRLSLAFIIISSFFKWNNLFALKLAHYHNLTDGRPIRLDRDHHLPHKPLGILSQMAPGITLA